MTKKVLFLLLGLLIFQFKSLARVEIYKQCTTICVSDGEGTACRTECEFVFVDVGGDGGGGSGDIDNGDDGDENGGGGGGDIDIYDSDGDGLMDCWKQLTKSQRITDSFGTSRNSGCGFHTGMDIGTAQEGGNIPLHSATSGQVVAIAYQSDQSGGTGYYIKVKNDNGSYTIYCHLLGTTDDDGTIHLTNSNLKVNDRVYPGMEIAYTDSSGGVNPHLDIKFYVTGNVSLSAIQEMFPGIDLNSSDVKYCSTKKNTYINPKKVLGDCD